MLSLAEQHLETAEGKDTGESEKPGDLPLALHAWQGLATVM